MTGFDVDLGRLRAAAGAARQAAGTVRGLRLDRVAELATALPGTESAEVARRLGPQWTDSCGRWAEGMESYAMALIAAADDYANRDDTAARGLRELGGR